MTLSARAKQHVLGFDQPVIVPQHEHEIFLQITEDEARALLAGKVPDAIKEQARAAVDGIPETTEDLHDSIRAKLPPAKWKILEALIWVYPKSLTKDALAERIEVSPTSGGYFNNLGSLRSLGLIDYPRPSEVAALPVLFLERQ